MAAGCRGKVVGGLGAAALLGLPIPPLPLPTPLPTPSLPGIVVPSPAPPVTITKQNPTAPAGAASPVQQHAATNPEPVAKSTPAGGGQPRRGVVIPFTAIYVDSPLNIALLAALATL